MDNLKRVCCVYKITSFVHPDRCYIGSSVFVDKRWQKHKKNLLEGTHNQILQNHCSKYGMSDLSFSIIEQFDFISKEHLLSREQFYIDNDPLNGYFNVAKIAGSCIGIKQSEALIEKKRRIMKGRRPYIATEDTKAKMRESQKKLPFVRKPQHYLKGQVSTFKGKHHSEEAKQKNREKHMGSHDAVMRGIETRRRNGNMMERDSKGRFKKKE